MRSRRRRAWLLALGAVALLSGCASGWQGYRIPGPGPLPAEEDPVVVMTPLVSVYRQELLDLEDATEGTIDPRMSGKAATAVAQALHALLAGRGWQPVASPALDWQGLSAGKELSARKAGSMEPLSMQAVSVLAALDGIGRKIRYAGSPGEAPPSGYQVDREATRALAGEAASLLFTVAVGCDGRLPLGPCGNIQVPLQVGGGGGEKLGLGGAGLGLSAVRGPVPLGMAIQAYWVEAASGRLLRYDEASRFNLDPGSGRDIAAIVERGLAGFPAGPGVKSD